jgi:isopentenyldiphosphate isomerase
MRPENDLSTIAVVDENDFQIGTAARRFAVENGLNYRVSHVIVTLGNSLVLQKLSSNHIRSPGLIGSSAAGFLRPKETYLQAAIRLMHDEIGVVDAELSFVAKIKLQEKLGFKFAGIFSGELNSLPQENPSQYSEILCVDFLRLKAMIANNPEAFAKTFLLVFQAWEKGFLYEKRRS